MKLNIILLSFCFIMFGGLLLEDFSYHNEIKNHLQSVGYENIQLTNSYPYLCKNYTYSLGFIANYKNKEIKGNVCEINNELKIKILRTKDV